ncbi:branched-chain amino acid transport system substrate-binding protein [Ruminococcus sp. YE71]|uniref:ABC transporter substrate-binding protein n=1 Tax=unclassified Ruminococcus TaxID=2608920 RepID=UPI00088C1627|nr:MULTISPECIES: ABC transporter substrate-binding protein [unclassified Ruminococcus]SDA27412.1 branched-chain amino acid transport system substrate-binding protein [Ruminococcus sp. YE78]SFW45106.1 branched-chain amino acid transport system substrate-binding protein [Ruminococcus sp. YE71]
MKMLKKILAFSLAAVMAGSCLSSCGVAENAANNKGGDGAASDAKTIVIGGSGPLTGGAAQYGVGVKNAMELAVNEVNSSGMLGDTKLQLIFEDDEADPADKAVNAYNTLKDKGMDIMIGTVTTGSCLAVIDQTYADGIFQITPSASAQDVIKNDNCFQVCFTDPNQGKASADYISGNNIAQKVAIIYDSSDAYSSGIYNTFKSEAETLGLEVVSEQSFTKDSKTDFSAQISACKLAGAELVFLPIYYQEASLILSQSASAGFSPIFFGCDGLDGILSVENFDTSLAEGVMLLTPFAADAKDEMTSKFVSNYKESYGGETPNQFAADAYDCVMIVAKLIKQEGITADMSASEINDKLKAAITNVGFTYDGLTGKTMTWNADGAVSKNPKAVIIRDGAYASLDENE